MALVHDNAFPADLGTLAADTVLTCERGSVGITTDGGDAEDCYKLSEGQRIVLASGLDVTVFRLAGPALVHHMPV